MTKRATIHPDPLVMALRKALKDTEPRKLPTRRVSNNYGFERWVCPYCDALCSVRGADGLAAYNIHFGLKHGTPFWRELHLIEVITNFEQAKMKRAA